MNWLRKALKEKRKIEFVGLKEEAIVLKELIDDTEKLPYRYIDRFIAVKIRMARLRKTES